MWRGGDPVVGGEGSQVGAAGKPTEPPESSESRNMIEGNQLEISVCVGSSYVNCGGGLG